MSKINKIRLDGELYELEDPNVPEWARNSQKPSYKTSELENDEGFLKEEDIDTIAGEDGATFTPSVSSDGVISWTNDKGLANPNSVNIKGPQGEKGEKGETGETGPQGNDYVLTDDDKEEIADLVKGKISTGTGNVSSDTINSIVVVESLPEVEEEGVLYLVKEIEEPAIEYVTNPTMQMGYLSTDDGTVSDSAEYCVPSDYIYIKGKPTLTITNSTNTSMRVVCYDADKNFMTNWFTDDDGTTYNYKRLSSGGQYTFPDDAYYIKFRITSTEIVNVTIAYE